MKMAGVLAILSVVLYLTGYWICEYFYADDIIRWRELRDLLTGVVIALLVSVSFLKRTSLSRAALVAFAVLCFGNLVDRLGLGITDFRFSDYALIVVAVIAGIKTYLYNVKRILE